MIENELLLKQILECDTIDTMVRHMIVDSSNINLDELGSKIENQKRVTKKSIAAYIKQNKEGLLSDIKAIKKLSLEFNSVDMIDRINSLENDVSFLENQIIKPYESLSNNLNILKEKANQVRLLTLIQDLGVYYEYGSDFGHINDPFILGK